MYFIDRFSLYIPCKTDAQPTPLSHVTFQLSERSERVCKNLHLMSSCHVYHLLYSCTNG